jgi:hypothetical protein
MVDLCFMGCIVKMTLILTGWTAVREDSKSRPKETSQWAKEGTPLGLPCGFLGEETEKKHGSH